LKSTYTYNTNIGLPKDNSHFTLVANTAAQLQTFAAQYHRILSTGWHWNFALHFRTFLQVSSGYYLWI